MKKGKRFTEEQQKQFVRQMMAPGGPSARELSRQLGGIPSSATLARFKAKWVGSFAFTQMRKRKPEAWSFEERKRAVIETTGMTEAQLEEYKNAHSISVNDLIVWRKEVQDKWSNDTLSSIESIPLIKPHTIDAVSDSDPDKKQTLKVTLQLNEAKEENAKLQTENLNFRKELEAIKRLLILDSQLGQRTPKSSQ